MEGYRAKVIAISRHRLETDGDGVTTLVAFHGCPLRCRYCLNPQSLGDDTGFNEYSPADLFAVTSVDELYFIATNGGVTFGGGEPGLRPEFIRNFRDLCGDEWQLNIETSLNIPKENLESLIPVVNGFFIDVKDMNSAIYKEYTGRDNKHVMENLKLLVDSGRQADCLIRLPLIQGYNTETDRQASKKALVAMGFTRFDLFTYIIRK